MSIGIAFWVLMILWVVFGFWLGGQPAPGDNRLKFYGGTVLELILFALIGWEIFGPALHR